MLTGHVRYTALLKRVVKDTTCQESALYRGVHFFTRAVDGVEFLFPECLREPALENPDDFWTVQTNLISLKRLLVDMSLTL